ncbi:MAG: segregation/condensation protein A [Alphaproteobacteria bacterium]|nr:segregation/condensation protein A [Alphaproteobacteria bacterium]
MSADIAQKETIEEPSAVSPLPEASAFEEDPPRATGPRPADEVDTLLLNIDGYEGPIDILLELARKQKVDLAKISILQLVRQYLVFIERAKALNLELAAEYLVMAAWLTYLKSRLYLPRDANSEEPSAEEMAGALQFQLQRLEAMQKCAEQLFTLPKLGQEVFARGMPEGVRTEVKTSWEVNLYDLLKAYGEIRARQENQTYDLPTFQLMSSDDALARLTRMLGNLPMSGHQSVWATLQSFLPEDLQDSLYKRSVLASTFTAGLELAKQGRLEIRQEGLFRPIYVRTIPAQAEAADGQ